MAQTHQRRGIGKRLMGMLFEMAREKGVRYAWVGTELDNGPARALYRSLKAEEEEMALYVFDLSSCRQK